MSSEVKRYDAVHIRYGENNIRYGEGLGVEMVTARDYDALHAEVEALRAENGRLRQSSQDVRALVSADDVRDACANAVSVFAEETNAGQCREVAEYMREVLLAKIARRQDQPQ